MTAVLSVSTAFIAAIGILCWLCFRHKCACGTEVDGGRDGSGLISEVTPAVIHSDVHSPKLSTPKRPKEVTTNFVNNVWLDEKGRPHYKVARVIRPGQRTIINGRSWRPERPVFHHPSEVELDVVLSRRPGERLFGDANWRAFESDLPSALADRIEILPDDTPDIIARKEAVMAAKRELLAAIKDGEKPSEILKAARDEVNRMADMRDNLLVTIAEMRRDGADEQQIEDAVSAANKLLEENGIDNPLVSPRTMRERAENAKLRRIMDNGGTVK